ncbi:hypothetical protein [Priestia megaterium]|uniref:hypothetical protein n=1 Tax=Priestia megaterium TaxID=1404 RepID=UPI0020409A84|nr:hypothetical protein [Priestia megaterium]MCM3186369.1 hypothetical protein [Priestia megaterium]
MKETHINHESIQNGFESLQIDDFTGEELKRVKLIKVEQEKLSKLKFLVLIAFLFSISIIFLFFIIRSKQEQISIPICCFYLIILLFLALLYILLKKYNYTKKKNNFGILLLLTITPIFWVLFKKQDIPNIPETPYHFGLWIPIILGYFSNIIVSILIYRKVFLLVAKKIKPNVSCKLDIPKLTKNVKFYYSITYLMANYFKDEIEKITKDVHNKEYCLSQGFFESKDKERTRIEVVLNSRIYKQYLIIFFNWINLIKTVIFAFLIIGLIGYEGFIINTLIIFFLCHFVSRTIEILYAFYKDIVRVDSKIFYNKTVEKLGNIGVVKYAPTYINGWKNSAIRKPMRISLAIHSIAEIALSFSLIYYFAALISTIYQTKFTLGFDYTMNFESYLKTLLYSTSISFFNFSFPNNNLLLSILHIWQLLISIVLISLSIASYIGNDDKLTDREARYFFYIDGNFKHPKE